MIGIRDDRSGELPRAFVVLCKGVEGNQETVERLKNHVKSKCARPKWLDGGVVFLKSIPKSPAGKILRRELRDKYAGNHEVKARL